MDVKKKFVSCAICKNRVSSKEIKIFTIPQCEKRRQRWIDSCGVQFHKSARVCEYHFADSDFINGRRPAYGKTVLLPGAVPSFELISSPQLMLDDDDDYSNFSELPFVDCSQSICVESSCQTEFPLDHSYRAEIYLLKQKITRLEEENAMLRFQIGENNYLETNKRKKSKASRKKRQSKAN